MVKTASLRATIFTALITATSAVAAQPVVGCNVSPDDRKAVTDTVTAFYEAERTGQGSRWRALTTPGFYMFHEGDTKWNADRFEKWIDRQQAALQTDKAARFTMELIDLKVVTDCTTAMTTQILHNVIDMPSRKERGHFDQKYQESLLLRKAPGMKWRIAFWHVTKMEDAPTHADAKD